MEREIYIVSRCNDYGELCAIERSFDSMTKAQDYVVKHQDARLSMGCKLHIDICIMEDDKY